MRDFHGEELHQTASSQRPEIPKDCNEKLYFLKQIQRVIGWILLKYKIKPQWEFYKKKWYTSYAMVTIFVVDLFVGEGSVTMTQCGTPVMGFIIKFWHLDVYACVCALVSVWRDRQNDSLIEQKEWDRLWSPVNSRTKTSDTGFGCFLWSAPE